MNILLKVLRGIAYEFGILIVVIIVGNIVYRLIGDLFPGVDMDRSSDAAVGAGVALGLLVLVVRIAMRLFRRKKLEPPPDKP